jgi:hypothetical protein
MSPIHRSSHPHTTTHSNNYGSSGHPVSVRPAAVGAILAAASVTTATKFIGFAFEVASSSELVPNKLGALLTVVIIVSWGGLFTAAVINRNDRNTALILERISEAVEEAGDRRATAATLAALSDRSAMNVGPRRPHLVES